MIPLQKVFGAATCFVSCGNGTVSGTFFTQESTATRSTIRGHFSVWSTNINFVPCRFHVSASSISKGSTLCRLIQMTQSSWIQTSSSSRFGQTSIDSQIAWAVASSLKVSFAGPSSSGTSSAQTNLITKWIKTIKNYWKKYHLRGRNARFSCTLILAHASADRSVKHHIAPKIAPRQRLGSYWIVEQPKLKL